MKRIALLCVCAGIAGWRRVRAAPRPSSSAAASSLYAQAEAMWKAARTDSDFKAIVPVFEALLKADPNNATYKVRYADLLAERFNATDAEALYQEALKIDDKNAKALSGSGGTLFRRLRRTWRSER